MAAPVDWTDPCARYAALRTAYFEAARGQRKSIHFQSGDTSQSVEYSPADMSVLKTEMDTAQRECQLAQGVAAPPQRFAIQAGSRRGARTIGAVPGFTFITEADGE